MHPVEKMTIFVSAVNKTGELEDIFIHDQRSDERDLTYVATKAVLVKDNKIVEKFDSWFKKIKKTKINAKK